ncbi:isoprenylcysteine carboxylmethyltransferase family protein [Phyllobacterium sp. SYP-B3895]|uniref:protein-S-isoprenylcysteine O-methyltransferase n=1 Tax=Phyllobacterium sp. SYP-B3895 TaxID=2663240 RepID=UPI001299B9F4|nr:protein-S-isoprenylcysteine O-methyltransferase [Phyllobacterium sp. SYP-B3895]MRG56788.1 isoprenylcysteine carboxylmethyltransferase family protein [Phyllobacterium sp. SYP-B3895]
MSIASIGEIIWVLGIIAWYVIRYPFERRARRVQVTRSARTLTDRLGLGIAFFGLAIVPGFYVATGIPKSADYSPYAFSIVLGAITMLLALWVFRRSHKELGRNWSITLEIREKHKLVSSGPYAFVRHPMYTSFLLIALGQAFLLANWVAGLAGLVGFSILFFLRVTKEERMMLENFGPEYRDYIERTKRLIPYLY